MPFITFEGGEGGGKSTQLAFLADALAKAGIDHLTTREPGGSAGAEEIRALIVNGEPNRWDAVTETLLLMAARHHHVRQVIEPALGAGKWVLCDRFFDSTRVYQGIGKGVDAQWLESLYHMLFANLSPSLTLYFDIDPAEGLQRAAARRGTEHRFESMPLAFHQSIREGFLHLAKKEPARIQVIDASGPIAEVHERVLQVIDASPLSLGRGLG